MKVRCNLQKGPHYMHWQFKNGVGDKFYHNPEDKIVKLYNCVLHNNRVLADKIYLGKDKDFCSWIKFKGMEFLDSNDHVPSWAVKLNYNPRVLPYWHDINGNNLDGLAFDQLYLCSKGVFFDRCRSDASPCGVMT